MTRSLLAILVIVVSLLNKVLWDSVTVSAIVSGACIVLAVSIVASLLIQRDREASS